MAPCPPDPIFNNPDFGSYSAASIDAMIERLLLENFKRATLDSGLYQSLREKQLLQSNEFWESEPRQQQPSPTRAKTMEHNPSWFTKKMKRSRDEELKEERDYEPWYSGSEHDHQQPQPPIQSGPDFTKFPRLPTPARPPSYAIRVGKPAPHDPVFAFGSSGEYCPSSDHPAAHPAIRSHAGANIAPVAPMWVAGPSGHYVPFSKRSDIAPVAPSRIDNGLVYAFGSSGEHSSSHSVNAPPRPAGSDGPCSSSSRSKSDRFSAQTHRAALSIPVCHEVNPYANHPTNFVPARTVQPYVNNLPQVTGTVDHHINDTTQRGREVSPADSGYGTNSSNTPLPQSSQNSDPSANPTFTNNPQIRYRVSQAHPAPVPGYESWVREVAIMGQLEIPEQEMIIAAQQMVRAQQEVFAQYEVYTQQQVPTKTEMPELPKPRRGRPPGTGGKYKQRAKKGDAPAAAGENDIPKAKRVKRSVAANSK